MLVILLKGKWISWSLGDDQGKAELNLDHPPHRLSLLLGPYASFQPLRHFKGEEGKTERDCCGSKSGVDVDTVAWCCYKKRKLPALVVIRL